MGLSQVSARLGSTGARQRCDRLAQWEMGRDIGPMREGEMRLGKKSSLVTENWAQRAKGI
jgi:hypothetical protein